MRLKNTARAWARCFAILGAMLMVSAFEAPRTDKSGNPLTLEERPITVHDSLLELPSILILDIDVIKRLVRDGQHPSDHIGFKEGRGTLHVQHVAGGINTFDIRSIRSFLDPAYFASSLSEHVTVMPEGAAISTFGTAEDVRLGQYQVFRLSGRNCVFAITGGSMNLSAAAFIFSETKANTLIKLFFCSESEADRDAALAFALNFEFVRDRDAYRQYVSDVLAEAD